MPISYNLNENFISSTRRFRNRIAVEARQGDSWKKYSYNELFKDVRSLAFFLSSLGIKKSDKVAIILENRPEWPVIFFAIAYTGAVAVPLDTRTLHKDIASILLDSEARFIFIPGENSDLNNFLKGIKQIESIIKVPFKDFQQPSESFKPASIEPDELAVLLYTSGTTQEPKGVMLTHKNLCANFNSINKLRLFSRRDSMLSILPLFHSYSLMTMLITPVFSGMKIIYVPGDWPDRLVEYVKTGKVSIIIGVPQMFNMIHSRIMKKINALSGFVRLFVKFFIKKSLGARFRFFVSGGAKLDETIARDFLNLGLKILEGYGLTETSPVVSINPIKSPRPGSCGNALPDVQVQIVNKDEDGTGEIVVKGPNVMKGYYKDDAKTKSSFNKDGWFLTGDLGYIDSYGYIYIKGRSKEVIVLSSGKNIYPEEIEKHYSKEPFIKEMCVLGVLKPKGEGKIEYLHALILPDITFFKGPEEDTIRKEITQRFEELSRELPGYKRLTGFTIIKENLPRTVLGKIKRYEVAKKFIPLILEEDKRREEVLTQEERILAESEIGKKVISCIREALDVKTPIRLSDSIQFDLGADSLGVIELVSAIEKCFNIEIDEQIVEKRISTVKDLIIKIQELLGRRGHE